MKKNLLSLIGLAAAGMFDAPTLTGKSGSPWKRMPQTDFENAVRAKAKAQIANDNRKKAEREASPKEKKLRKKSPVFSNNYIGMPKKSK